VPREAEGKCAFAANCVEAAKDRRGSHDTDMEFIAGTFISEA
jgi:hypothetical protein